jgi:uncharacterized membrane protein
MSPWSHWACEIALCSVRIMEPSPHFLAMLQGGAEWLRLGLAMIGAAVILVGTVVCLLEIGRAPAHRGHRSWAAARLSLARYLALALEFQLAADVIETSIVPDWTKIGRLAAIAAIRTALNYFLNRDMTEDRRLARDAAAGDQASGAVNSR